MCCRSAGLNRKGQSLLYRQASMSSSKHYPVPGNQTLFDFLRRKQHTPRRSPPSHHPPDKQNNPSSINQVQLSHKPSQPQRRGILKQGITPKKITFHIEERQKANLKGQTNQSKGKSFIALISPHKGRQRSLTPQEQPSQTQTERTLNQNRSARRDPVSHSHKQVTEHVDQVRNCIESLQDSLSIIKNKIHRLGVIAEPVLREVSSHQGGEIRNMIRNLQALVGSASTHAVSKHLQLFHREVEAHLKSEEGRLRRQAETSRSCEVDELRQVQQRLTAGLEGDCSKLQAEKESLLRKVQRLQEMQEGVVLDVGEKQAKWTSRMERLRKQYQDRVRHLQEENEVLKNNCEQMREQEAKLQSSLRRLREEKVAFQEQMREETSQVLQRKEDYLLNEIAVLKAEFAADLERMDQMHRAKEGQLLGRLREREEQWQRGQFERKCDRERQGRVMEEGSRAHAECAALQEKNQCIVADMFRMNEELYQHWLALKDIRQLSRRLGTYSHLQSIYNQLRFDDTLFH